MKTYFARAFASVFFLVLGMGALSAAAMIVFSDAQVRRTAAALARQDAREAQAHIAALEKLPAPPKDDFAVAYYKSRNAYAAFYETGNAAQLAAAEGTFFSVFQEAQKRGNKKIAASVAYDRGTMLLETVAGGHVASPMQARSSLERAAYWFQIALTLETDNEASLHQDAQWNLELTLRFLSEERMETDSGDQADDEETEGRKPGEEPGGRQGGPGLTHPPGY